MTPRQKHSILQLVQQLTEEASAMGALIAEDNKDTRPLNQRGSTHECRKNQAARVKAIRMQIEAELSQIVTDDAAFCGTSQSSRTRNGTGNRSAERPTLNS